MVAPNLTEPEGREILEWRLGDVITAEARANEGSLELAALLCDRLFADDRISGTLRHRVSLIRLPLTFEEGTGGHAKQVIKALESGDYWAVCPKAELEAIHKWGIGLGVGLGRLEWIDPDTGKAHIRDGRNVPRLKHWHPQHLEWDWQVRKWFCYVGHEGLRVEVTPGDGEWLLYTPYGDSRPWQHGLWRVLKLWWILKQFAQQDWGRHNEKLGLGAFVAKNVGTEKGTDEQRKKLGRELKRLGREKGFALPPGWDIDLIEATARTWEAFAKQIELADTANAIAIAGQNLTSEVSAGSFAAATVHSKIAAAIIGADGEALSDFEHEQVQRPYATANFGDAEAAPWPVRDTTPPEDDTKRTQSQAAVLALPVAAKTAGYEIENFEELAEQAGLQLKAIEAEDESQGDEGNDPPDGDNDEDPETDLDGEPEEGEDDPDVDPDESDGDDGESTASKARRRPSTPFVRTVGGDVLAASSGFVEGQTYVDDVVANAQNKAAELTAGTVTKVVRAINAAKDEFDLRDRLIAIMGETDPADLAEVGRRAAVLCELAGQRAVLQDAPARLSESDQ